MSLPFFVWGVYEYVKNGELLSILIMFCVFMCIGLIGLILGISAKYTIDENEITYKFWCKSVTIKKDDILAIKRTNSKLVGLYIIPNTLTVDFLLKIKHKFFVTKEIILKSKGCVLITETEKVRKCLYDFGYYYDRDDYI